MSVLQESQWSRIAGSSRSSRPSLGSSAPAGKTWKSRRGEGEVAPRRGKPRLRATVDKMCGRLVQKEAPFFFFFFFLLFNILKYDERINEARLPDPYVPFSAACA